MIKLGVVNKLIFSLSHRFKNNEIKYYVHNHKMSDRLLKKKKKPKNIVACWTTQNYFMYYKMIMLIYHVLSFNHF